MAFEPAPIKIDEADVLRVNCLADSCQVIQLLDAVFAQETGMQFHLDPEHAQLCLPVTPHKLRGLPGSVMDYFHPSSPHGICSSRSVHDVTRTIHRRRRAE